MDKVDLRQVGGGAGGAFLVMVLLQQQGIGVINKNQEAVNQAAIIKSEANLERIKKNEKAISNMTDKLESGFEGIREQIREQRDYIVQFVQSNTADRFTKAEHYSYAESVRERFKLLDREINLMNAKIQKLENQK